MILDTAWFRKRLESLTDGDLPSRWLVAYSGGADSVVLLHLLRASQFDNTGVLALHVDHGLHPDSGRWAAHCRDYAAEMGVECVTRKAAIDPAGAAGVEAAARAARYDIFLAEMQPGDCLLSAHHESDQAETLLLNLVRGSGPAGLAGIGEAQEFGCGRLLRPLLGVTGNDIRNYAAHHSLRFVDDPSNDDVRFDRNFLRRDVMPVLAGRWPAIARQLAHSARLAGESSSLLKQLAALDIEAAGSAGRLDLGVLRNLGGARVRNLLRHAVDLCGLPPPPATRLYQAVDELLPARADAQPRICWDGAEIRRYRDRLFILPLQESAPAPPQTPLRPGIEVELGAGAGSLRLLASAAGGIAPDLAAAGLQVRFRQGGERIRPAGDSCTRDLKKLLQQSGVVPWMRERIPLLYADDTLVAVADRWVAEAASHTDGFRVDWRGHSPLG